MKKLCMLAVVFMLFGAAAYANGMMARWGAPEESGGIVLDGDEVPGEEGPQATNRLSYRYERADGSTDGETIRDRDQDRVQLKDGECDENPTKTKEQAGGGPNDDPEAKGDQVQTREQTKDEQCDEDPEKKQAQSGKKG